MHFGAVVHRLRAPVPEVARAVCVFRLAARWPSRTWPGAPGDGSLVGAGRGLGWPPSRLPGVAMAAAPPNHMAGVAGAAPRHGRARQGRVNLATRRPWLRPIPVCMARWLNRRLSHGGQERGAISGGRPPACPAWPWLGHQAIRRRSAAAMALRLAVRPGHVAWWLSGGSAMVHVDRSHPRVWP